METTTTTTATAGGKTEWERYVLLNQNVSQVLAAAQRALHFTPGTY